MSIQKKYNDLIELLKSYESVLIAFSGGCDSALVAKVASLCIGKRNVLAVTSKSESFPKNEIEEVNTFVNTHQIPHLWINTHEIDNSQYTENSSNRCYFCKTELYGELKLKQEERALNVIINGAQQDDKDDWRPGLHAAKEYCVRSPLMDAGFHKKDVRELSNYLGLSTWDKPAAACLSSRIPHGLGVTPTKLDQIDRGEQVIKEAGFKIVRLRHLGNEASIEVGKEEMSRFENNENLKKTLFHKIKLLGFKTVVINPEGYRQGNMNRLEPPGSIKNAVSL